MLKALCKSSEDDRRNVIDSRPFCVPHLKPTGDPEDAYMSRRIQHTIFLGAAHGDGSRCKPKAVADNILMVGEGRLGIEDARTSSDKYIFG